MIKAVFFDLDGTLMSHTMRCIPASALKALEILKKNGIPVFLATGRHICDVENLAGDKIDFSGMVILNGQVCLDKTGEIIFEAPIQPDNLAPLLEAFQEKKLPVVLVEGNEMYINFINDDVRRVQKAITSPLPAVGSYRGGKVYQAMAYGDEETIEKLSKVIPGCRVNWWHQDGVDIIDKRGGKVAGIRCFMEKYGWEPEEIMAFGDGQNDVEMLRLAGIGVAMGNAADEVKQAADYVTSHIDRDGVYNALAHFGLL